MGLEPQGQRFFLRPSQGFSIAAHHNVIDAGVGRLGRFFHLPGGTLLHQDPKGSGRLFPKAVPGQDVADILDGGAVLIQRGGSDGLQVVADDIGKHQNDPPRLRHRSQPAALYQGKMLSYRVHFVDRHACRKKHPRHFLEILKGQRRNRLLNQGGTSAGQKVDEKVLLREPGKRAHQPFRRMYALGIGNGVSSHSHVNAVQFRLVTGHHQPPGDPVSKNFRHRFCHAYRGLAAAENEDLPPGLRSISPIPDNQLVSLDLQGFTDHGLRQHRAEGLGKDLTGCLLQVHPTPSPGPRSIPGFPGPGP
ncbi:MAG: hypothetical protein A4E70_02502 [Syntrophus sp. PtaU1.Bin005]|nr:MAG: hypothetical protein A4E70_02502 [Syntrophus sp. PtaU1.Bin005]